MELIFLYLPPFPGRGRFSSVLFWFSFAEGLVLPSPWLPGCVSQAVGGTRIPGNQLNSFSVKVKGGTAFPRVLDAFGEVITYPQLVTAAALGAASVSPGKWGCSEGSRCLRGFLIQQHPRAMPPQIPREKGVSWRLAGAAQGW